MVCKVCYAKYHWRTPCSLDQNGNTLVLNLPLRPGCSKPHQTMNSYSTQVNVLNTFQNTQPQIKVQAFLTPADTTDNTNYFWRPKSLSSPSCLQTSPHPWITTAMVAGIKTQPSLELLCAVTHDDKGREKILIHHPSHAEPCGSKTGNPDSSTNCTHKPGNEEN